MEIKKKPEIRFLYDIKKVIYDKEWLRKQGNLELYYIYRGVKKKKGLRYDITLVPPKMLGEEFVRTKGNRNCKNFPELYTVIKGKAIFLMQKAQGKTVEDVFAVKVSKNNWVIAPPKYAVVMINPAKKVLKTGNWVSERNENIYKELGRMGGACYYYTKKGWIKNKNYKKIPKLRMKRPLKKMPKSLSFLK